MYLPSFWTVALVVAIASVRPGLAQEARSVPPPSSTTTPTTETDRVVFTLDELLRSVRDANPALRAAKLEVAARRTWRAQATALPDPSVTAGYRPLALDAVSDAVPGLRLQQDVPFPGKLVLEGRAADYETERARHEAAALEAELLLQVKLAYYQLYHLQQHDGHVRRFQASLLDYEAAAATRYEVGRGTQQAVLKAQLEKNALARERLRLAERRRTAVETLARLVNRPDLVRYVEEVVVAAPVVTVDSVRAVAVAYAERPEVERLEAELGLADTRVEIARKAFLPDFVLEVGFMDMGGTNGLGDRLSIGGGIRLPLQRGRRTAALDEARVRRAQVEAHYETLKTEIQTRVHELQYRLREAADALALYEATLLPQAESTLEAALSAYTTGQVGFLDLLDAERMRFELHVERERTYLAYLRGRAELERALGVDTLDDALLAHTPATR